MGKKHKSIRRYFQCQEWIRILKESNDRDMNKSVCMFVWNHFTNDARVLRECTTLSRNGYDVDLICIDDPNDATLKTRESLKDSFNVYRVRRYPITLTILQSILRITKKHKWLLIVMAIIFAFMLFYFMNPTLIIAALLFIIYIPAVRKALIKLNIIIRMIGRGFMKRYTFYHSNDLNTLPQGYICSKWRFKRKKLVYDSHEVQTSRTGYNSPVYGKLEKFLIDKIDTMIVENHTRAKYNEDLYGFYPNVLHNYPFKTISEELNKINLHTELNLPPQEKILLYQGGIQIGRGLEMLIEAVPRFQEGILVLIGDGNQKAELIQLVKQKQLEHRVKFLPKVPLEDLPKYTQNAYLGFQVLNNICFNHWSASSNKLFEYMMAKVPVIACSFPEIKKVVQENDIGICVDSHSPADIARGVNELLLDESKRNRMSENCIKAQHNYNWEKEEEKLINIYQQI